MEYKMIVVDWDTPYLSEQIQRLDQCVEQWHLSQREQMAMDMFGGPWEYPIVQTDPEPTPRVSKCCGAPVFFEEGRWICQSCRLGTQPVIETEASG